MSTINVTNLSGRGGATPNLPDGANITGVATATTFSGTLDGSLKSTGTPTLGLGVTINASGLHISGVTTVGVVTGGTYYGSGTNLTGVGESVAPWHYNPDVNDSAVDVTTGIGITFNKKVVAGSGTATLKIVNAGAAGTTIQSWGVSSCTFDVQAFTMGALVSNLDTDQTYQVDIPSGFVVDGSESATDYVGTAYTFTAKPAENKLFAWGYGSKGRTGHNNTTDYSSPVQIPGTTWRGSIAPGAGSMKVVISKTDGTLWAWGDKASGSLAQNNETEYSSPVQIGTDTTWTAAVAGGYQAVLATKTDGTLWAWGLNSSGGLGLNNDTKYSSPVQVPGTTWPKTGDNKITFDSGVSRAVKTDGTLWSWGANAYGKLGINNHVDRSSPTQIPGTTWNNVLSGGEHVKGATRTDGTLWMWGQNTAGPLGQNNTTSYSSPVQIPGTTWSSGGMSDTAVGGIRTDGTLWTWGDNSNGELGLNNTVQYSSPVQIPGTTWSKVVGSLDGHNMYAIKTDGTLWAWGKNERGQIGNNSEVPRYSSPVQVGTDTGYLTVRAIGSSVVATQLDVTP